MPPQYPEADILMSNDQLITTAEGEELEHWPASGWSANAGFKLFRPRAAQFVKVGYGTAFQDARCFSGTTSPQPWV